MAIEKNFFSILAKWNLKTLGRDLECKVSRVYTLRILCSKSSLCWNRFVLRPNKIYMDKPEITQKFVLKTTQFWVAPNQFLLATYGI
jgi:hypothetical protein